MSKAFILLFTVALATTGFTQNSDWLTFPVEKGDTISKIAKLDYSTTDGSVTVHKDSRIDKIAEFVRSGEESLDGVLIDGYRVLIYFDQDKTKSEQQKAHFMSLYNEHQAYVDYMAPNYRVRVGNFRTRLEAEKLKQEILAIFMTAIVVEDKIQLPSLDQNTGSNN